eukprot:scaffold7382_cov406-Prasinococcus_capsulatus_cf.AAC.14
MVAERTAYTWIARGCVSGGSLALASALGRGRKCALRVCLPLETSLVYMPPPRRSPTPSHDLTYSPYSARDTDSRSAPYCGVDRSWRCVVSTTSRSWRTLPGRRPSPGTASSSSSSSILGRPAAAPRGAGLRPGRAAAPAHPYPAWPGAREPRHSCSCSRSRSRSCSCSCSCSLAALAGTSRPCPPGRPHPIPSYPIPVRSAPLRPAADG